jgi:hypothetical protein
MGKTSCSMSRKLLIVTISLPPNYQTIVNVPQGQQKDKNDPTNFLIRQKYPYELEKKNNFIFFKK